MNTIEIRKTQKEDLNKLFDFQADDDAGCMAAFVSNTWKDREGYIAKWEKFLQNDSINSYTIFLNGAIVGSVGTWVMGDEPQITYGIGKAFWGKGIATTALALFLKKVDTYPLYGRAASDNIRSIKILERAGFVKTGTGRGFAAARNQEIEEVIFRLDK